MQAKEKKPAATHGPSPVKADEAPRNYGDTLSKGLEYLAKCQLRVEGDMTADEICDRDFR
jgi:hypothetical protein